MESRKQSLIFLILMIVLMAITYLPLIGRLGYFNDDWYLMYAARVEGPSIFHQVFQIDRPLRAYVLGPAFSLFGENPIYYNVSAWFFRVVSALCFLWALRMVWPHRPWHTFMMALLYGLYPGFLSQHNGIDYQSQMLSLALAMLSLALTVSAFFESRRFCKVFWIALAVILGWGYLGLVEYEVGFEFTRMAFVFVLTLRSVPAWKDALKRTFWISLPYLLIPLGYAGWRIFLFENERKATDLAAQFGQVALYPLQTVYRWIVQVAQDTFDVLISAWVVPLLQLNDYVQLWSAVVTLLLAGLVIFLMFRTIPTSAEHQDQFSGFTRESLLLGLLSAVAGVVPVVLVNRQVEFPAFSRYALVSSAGVAAFAVALISVFNRQTLQSLAYGALMVIAMLTQQANMVKYAQESDAVRTFWWQVAWRVPQFKQNTTLMVRYPIGAIEEDYFIWGPANLIYYQENLSERETSYIRPGVFAFVLNDKTVQPVLMQQRQDYEKRRATRTFANPRNLVVLSKPTLDSCVQVMDRTQPEFSSSEIPLVMVVTPYSKVEQILTDDSLHTPPHIPFGPEPVHDWCYYFEKASLARQRGDWQDIVRLGKQAIEAGFLPKDKIEWMPFVQAFAKADDQEYLTYLAQDMAGDPFALFQACQTLQGEPNILPATLASFCPQ